MEEKVNPLKGPRRNKAQKLESFIENTWLFQRVAGQPLTPREDLEKEFNSLKPAMADHIAKSNEEHAVIARMAQEAGKKREN